MARHQLAAAAAFAVLAVECAAGLPPHAGQVTTSRDGVEHLAAPSALPAGVDVRERVTDPTAPAPAAAADPAPAPMPPDDGPAPPLPEAVDVVRPDVRVDGVAPDAMSRLPDLDALQDAVLVRTVQLQADGPEGPESLTAVAIDSPEFRRFTPDVTANEVGVWQRLQEGNVVLTAAVANRLDVDLGGQVTLSGEGGSEARRIGALAANGLPQLADLMVPAEVAERLTGQAEHTLLLAVGDQDRVDGVTASVRDAVGGEAERLVEPERQRVSSGQVGRTTLESFTYQSVGDGTIRIEPGWVSRNIVTTTVPLLGQVTCHRVVVPQLHAALQEIQSAGLAEHIDQYGGCWVPRHILWDPSRGISNHAWGLALDINVAANQYGANPTMHPQVVEVFRRWGFAWGGDWSTPDGMHFELERVVRP